MDGGGGDEDLARTWARSATQLNDVIVNVIFFSDGPSAE
jgi:hypothetical protein